MSVNVAQSGGIEADRPEDPAENAGVGGQGHEIILDFRFPIFDSKKQTHEQKIIERISGLFLP
jgi:hypothetical protein